MLVACHFVHQERTHSTSALHMNASSHNNNNAYMHELESHEMPGQVALSPTRTLLAAPVFNGRCKYKSGRCMNERTLKDNGLPHTLCEEHRVLHNKNQRKSDTKRRRLRKGVPYEPSRVTPTPSSALSLHLIHHHPHHHHLDEYRSAGSTYSSDQEDSINIKDEDGSDHDEPTTPTFDFPRPHDATPTSNQPPSSALEWSTEEISMLHSMLGISTHPRASCERPLL